MATAGRPGGGTTSSPDTTIRILIVEDEGALSDIMCRLVRALGFEVETASDGASALERLDIGSFTVIVSDIGLPGMSGLDFLSALRKQEVEAPVVFVTGMPSVDSAIRAIEFGAFHYLTKPFSHAEFREVIQRAVQFGRLAQLKRRALESAGLVGGGIGGLEDTEARFLRALDRIWMAWQPILRVNDLTVFGHEALLRSDEPKLQNPGQLLSAAEYLQQLDELGRRVRWHVAETMESRPELGAIFLNLHPRDLLDDDLFASDSPLTRHSSRVVLEITERASLQADPQVTERVSTLRKMGFRVAIDDLGAGYASLTSFVLLQPDIVKVDMSLVRDVDSSPVKRRLVQSITQVCREMDILVVAEGIETVAERDALIELGCDLLQGYLFARPARLISCER